MSGKVSTEFIYLLYHFTSSTSRAWKLYQNCLLKDEDLDLVEQRDQIGSKLKDVHANILRHSNHSDWTKEIAAKVLKDVTDVNAMIFNYCETTDVRMRLNLQNKMSFELDTYQNAN